MSGLENSRQSQSFPSRNPRRRQRKESEEGGSVRLQPVRKRSKLSGDTFGVPIDHNAVSNLHNGHKVNGNHVDIDMNGTDGHPGRHMPVRDRQNGGSSRRRLQRDDAQILTNNSNYTVSQLPNFPAQLRQDKRDFRAYYAPPSSYALALTREQALVWDMDATNTSSTTRSFTLAHPSKLGDPLPFGALVTSTPANEVGLVVVAPTSGKITYWENIENADALSLFEQRRNGIEASIPGMFSGEQVTALDNINHAGFLITLSSRRTAQLTLRNSQGRVEIKVHPFRANPPSNATGGLFGGLRNMFGGGSWLKEIVATRSRPSMQSGHVESLISDKAGYLQLWELSWTGQAILKGQSQTKDQLTQSVLESLDDSELSESLEVQVLDFAFMTEPAEKLKRAHANDRPLDILVLAAAAGGASSRIILVELNGSIDNLNTGRSLLLGSYAAPLITKSSWTPKICVPPPIQTAFIVFEQAVVLVSLPTLSKSAEKRITLTGHEEPDVFQDTIYFRDDDTLHVVGVACLNSADHFKRQSAITVFLRGVGIVEIVAHEQISNGAAARSEDTIKSKIEQAVFYGNQSSNPLDLSRKPEKKYALEDVEAAALEVSLDVVRSSSVFTPSVSYSTEHQLEARAKTLRRLAIYLKQNFPRISRLTRWRLLWDAEKMAAACQVWKDVGKTLDQPIPDQTSVLPSLIKLLHERHKTPSDLNGGELDPIRNWFVKDIWRIETMIPWAHETVSQIYKEDSEPVRDRDHALDLLSQANDIVLAAMETAFAFRSDNLELYGLESEVLKEGVLQSGYNGLSDFWTSGKILIDRIHRQSTLARELTWKFSEGFSNEEPLPDLFHKISKDVVRLVKVCCLCFDERTRYYLGQDAEGQVEYGHEMQRTFEASRFEMLVGLTKVGQVHEGMELAEKYHDMKSLLYQVAEESDYLLTFIREDSVERAIAADARAQIKLLQERISSYFVTFGKEWADTFYNRQIRDERFFSLLDQPSLSSTELTRFLRADKSRAKISWINDVLGEKDYTVASKALLEQVASEEENMWSKKVELSIAKLSLLAGQEHSGMQSDRPEETKWISAALLIKTQEMILEHIRPCLYGAVDETAELQLAMESYGQYVKQRRPSLQQLLERAMESLLNRTALDANRLIDLLTLMDTRRSDMRAHDISGQEFYLALHVLASTGLDASQPAVHSMLQRLIWKRCLLRDDWAQLNDTRGKTDDEVRYDLTQTILFMTFREGIARGMWADVTTDAITAPAPSTCIGAGSKPQDYAYRFPSRDLQAPIARDVAADDKDLNHFIKHDRLEHWFTSCKELAVTLHLADAEAKVQADSQVELVKQALRDRDSDVGVPID